MISSWELIAIPFTIIFFGILYLGLPSHIRVPFEKNIKSKVNFKILYTIIGIFFSLSLLLLITDRRILIYETINNNQLSCTYFTGRKFVTIYFNYSANNFGGKDSCPFLQKQY
jgi:hypothetical protein